MQVAASCSDIADAVLRLCLQSLGMPGNALASVLDDVPPPSGVTPASLLQATNYSSAQALRVLCPQPLLERVPPPLCVDVVSMNPVTACMARLCPWCACNWSWLRLLHGTSDCIAAGQQGIVAEAHTDRGLLTVVWEGSPGLEVSCPRTHMPMNGAESKTA